AFLRVPPDCRLRPVLTGWFSEFATLDQTPSGGGVLYGAGASRWAGATYDPVSNYRAAAVFAFHAEHGLTAERLRAISRHQVGLLLREFEGLDIDPSVAQVEPMADERRAGFLAVRAPRAGTLCAQLRS